MSYRAWIEKSEFNIPSHRISEALGAVMSSKGAYESPKSAVKNIKHFEHLPPVVQFIGDGKQRYFIAADQVGANIGDGKSVAGVLGGMASDWLEYSLVVPIGVVLWFSKLRGICRE